MGEGLISSGELYCNGELLEAVKEIELSEEEIEIPSAAELEFVIKIDSKMWRKLLGYISQKRFRKILYSIGYGRNAANEIIKVEWHCKRSYNLRDVEYWKSIMEGK